MSDVHVKTRERRHMFPQGFPKTASGRNTGITASMLIKIKFLPVCSLYTGKEYHSVIPQNRVVEPKSPFFCIQGHFLRLKLLASEHLFSMVCLPGFRESNLRCLNQGILWSMV